MTHECKELKRALEDLADKGELDRFLKMKDRISNGVITRTKEAKRSLRETSDSLKSYTIAGGFTGERLNMSSWRRHFRSARQVMTTEAPSPINDFL